MANARVRQQCAGKKSEEIDSVPFSGDVGIERDIYSAVPYFAGANRLSICSGLPLRIAQGITPEIFCGKRAGGR
jgi:hypothetical protein